MDENATTASQAPGLNSVLAKVWSWITGKETRLEQLELEAAAVANIKAELEKGKAALTQAHADLATAKQTISSLETKVETLTKEKAEAARISAEEVSRQANTLAGQRLATLGVKPVVEEVNAEPNQQGSLVDAFNAETNPEKKSALYQRIRSEIWKLN